MSSHCGLWLLMTCGAQWPCRAAHIEECKQRQRCGRTDRDSGYRCKTREGRVGKEMETSEGEKGEHIWEKEGWMEKLTVVREEIKDRERCKDRLGGDAFLRRMWCRNFMCMSKFLILVSWLRFIQLLIKSPGFNMISMFCTFICKYNLRF